MGIIQKQSISGTIYSYLGVLLGFFITGLLFPNIFTTSEVGLLRLLVSYSVLFAQFAGLGFSAVTVKLFPYFRDASKKHHGFLGLALLVSLGGFLISLLVLFLLKPFIIERALDKSELFVTYFKYVVPLIFFTLLFNVFDAYYRVLYNAVKGIILKQVIQRLFILAAVLLYYFEFINFATTVVFYAIALIIPSIILFISLILEKQFYLKPDIKFLTPKLINEMIGVGFFGILLSFSGVLVLNIDVIMVNDILGIKAAGIYTIAFFFGTLVLIPLRPVIKISSVVIAESWKNNDIQTIHQIYKKSSINLTIIGLIVLVGIWGNIDNIFQLIKDDYLPGKMIVLYIGIANVLDMAIGVSNQIIFNSKYYKNLSYFFLVFAVLLIITNILLIPRFGITGAAIASLVSKFIFNSIKYIFLYRKFKFQPFNFKYILLLLIALITYFLSRIIPVFPNFILDIFIRSTAIFIIFSIPVYAFRISEDINDKINKILIEIGFNKKSDQRK
ncbi:MAG: hypothetical protein B6D61_12795 [Bacteroidetes bacterium 4484_249]|nr:MAG: hypothetical protein B6D61_12795 [Bacteroidetes bacterium 4484_249]